MNVCVGLELQNPSPDPGFGFLISLRSRKILRESPDTCQFYPIGSFQILESASRCNKLQ